MQNRFSISSVFSVVLIMAMLPLFAQQSRPAGGGRGEIKIGSISGSVKDAENGSAVEFANVLLLRSRDSSMVAGIITNAKGEFSLSQLPLGNFILKISFLGYKDLNTSITLTTNAPEKILLNLKLSSNATLLQAAEVVGEKKLIEYSLDKKVVNVEKSLVSEGGTATDVLSNVPSVSVDVDGNVSMKGSSNVTILIDGKPAVLSGVGLDQLPANTIESIEIISNPSSKYNPEGMAGIINIKTKRKKFEGLSGSANASVSTAERYNASLNLNYGIGDWSLFMNGGMNVMNGGRTGTSTTISELSNKYYPTDIYQRQDEISERTRNGYGGNLKLGAEYRINMQNSIMLTGEYSLFNNENGSKTPNTITKGYSNPDSTHWLQTLTSESDGNNNFNNYGLTLNYKHTTARPREELTFDISAKTSANSGEGNTKRIISNPDSTINEPQNNDTKGDGYDIDAQLNYLYPIGKDGKIEVGYQGKMRGSSSNDLQYLYGTLNADLSNDFSSNENIQGIYATFGNTYGPWSFQLGGRVEYASMDGHTVVPTGATQNHDTSFDYNYTRFYPSIHISRKLGKIQELQLSYSRRVRRPSAWDLNPFVNYSNFPVSIEFGNPALRPEDIQSLELNHSIYWPTTTLYTTAYYRYVSDMIQRYTFQDSVRGEWVRATTRLNYASGTNYGFDVVVDQKIFKWWSINLTGSFYQNIVNGNNVSADLNTEGLSYSFKANSNMSFPSNFNIQLSFNFRGPQYRGQSKQEANFSSELALRKGFMKNKWNVGLRLSDIFNTQEFNNFTTGNGFTTESNNKRLNSRALYFTIGYNFNTNGNGRSQKRKTERNTNEVKDNNGQQDDF